MIQTDFLQKFKDVHLIVAGEVGIDEYIWGDTDRISPEAPVPVIEVEQQTTKLGLAANVAQNIVSLGGKVTLISILGDDGYADTLEGLARSQQINKTCFLKDDSRPTSRKVRIMAQKQHVVRVDYEKVHALSPRLTKEFTDHLCDSLPSCDGIIVQDYGKGLWSADSMGFIKQAKHHKKPVFVDPSRHSPLTLYEGATLLTPNIVEAEVLCRFSHAKTKAEAQDSARLEEMALKILDTTNSEHSIVTCGQWGMVSVSWNERRLIRIPTFARQVFDVTGAGDTVIAVLSMLYVLQYPLGRCMQIANAAAGVVVGQVGTASVAPGELTNELERLDKLGLLTEH